MSLLLQAGIAVGITPVTLDPSVQSLTGGVGALDRAKYFNYHGTLVPPVTSLRESIYNENGLNASAGRVSTELDQFIAANLPEDPSRPGYIDPAAAQAKIQGDYRNFVLTGTRWEPLRNIADKPIFVQSGRNGGFFPDYMDSGTPIPTNYDAYADFLNVYLDEAVYGANAFLPIDQDRFFLEVMNEPNWSLWTQWNEVIDLHRVVTEQVKEQFPQTKIGGMSCCDDLESGANSWNLAKQVIDDMATWQTPSGQSVQLDFYSIHPYERYDVQSNGSWVRAVDTSPGHVAGIMDLYEAYSFNTLGDPKQFAITEYGSFNWAIPGTSDYGNYARDEQQWDLVRDIVEKMLVFMDRPDRIVNATPFVSPRHWQSAVPTNPEGDNVFFEQDASGAWNETIVASMFRMFAPVSGQYVHIDSGNPDLQAVAFREGSELHVILNNLDSVSQAVDLGSIPGVNSATWSRVYRAGGVNHFQQGVDITGAWQSLTLEGDASAVVTLQLDGPEVYDHAHDTRSHYGDRTEVVIVPQQPLEIDFDAVLEDAVGARLRVSYGLTTPSIPAIEVLVNGNLISIGDQQLDYDDGDLAFLSREVVVPLAYLNDGHNDVSFNFTTPGTAGKISAAVLEVTRTIGDFDLSGQLDAGDIDSLYARFGAAASDDKFDLNHDQVIDTGDLDRWLQLRNVAPGDADADGDIDTSDAVAVLANLGLSGTRPDWTQGNFDADGSVGFNDLLNVTNNFNGSQSTALVAPAVGAQADNPDIVYTQETGLLEISADGLNVVAFSIGAASGFVASASFAEFDAAVMAGTGLSDNTTNQIGWMSASVFAGQGIEGSQRYSLGPIAPAGMSISELEAYLATAAWAGIGVGGGSTWLSCRPCLATQTVTGSSISWISTSSGQTSDSRGLDSKAAISTWMGWSTCSISTSSERTLGLRHQPPRFPSRSLRRKSYSAQSPRRRALGEGLAARLGSRTTRFVWPIGMSGDIINSDLHTRIMAISQQPP